MSPHKRFLEGPVERRPELLSQYCDDVYPTLGTPPGPRSPGSHVQLVSIIGVPERSVRTTQDEEKFRHVYFLRLCSPDVEDVPGGPSNRGRVRCARCDATISLRRPGIRWCPGCGVFLCESCSRSTTRLAQPTRFARAARCSSFCSSSSGLPSLRSPASYTRSNNKILPARTSPSRRFPTWFPARSPRSTVRSHPPPKSSSVSLAAAAVRTGSHRRSMCPTRPESCSSIRHPSPARPAIESSRPGSTTMTGGAATRFL